MIADGSIVTGWRRTRAPIRAKRGSAPRTERAAASAARTRCRAIAQTEAVAAAVASTRRGDRRRDQVAKRVVDRAHRHRRRLPGHHRRETEEVAGLEQVDDDVAGDELQLPLADHADRVGGRAALRSRIDVAGRQVDDLDRATDLLEVLRVELGERVVLTQERDGLHGRSIARAD